MLAAPVHTVARETASDSHEKDDPLVLFGLAIRDSREAYKVIAACLGVDPPYFSKMLKGERPLPFAKLALVPRTVRRLFAKLYAEAHDWQVIDTDERERVLQDAQAAIGRALTVIRDARLEVPLVMAKADV